MRKERYRRVKEVFAAAVGLKAGEREDYLALACAGDAELCAEVESLLAHDGAAEDFIEVPAFEVAARLLADGESRSLEGGRVGPYRLVKEIGRGGMGAVFLAERADGEFEQEVALKVVRRGFADPELTRRLRRERQILASLSHENISRLLDGGVSADGEPFFAMEHIEGTRIDDYCDARGLDARARLRLFARVCDAVSYAHQRLVVHRDIKPSNILVTPEGVPKLLDFGIAKLLDPEHAGEQTRTEYRAFTPEYASPEQLGGAAVTTASDVYSLGVLLRNLLQSAGARAALPTRRRDEGGAGAGAGTAGTNLPTRREEGRGGVALRVDFGAELRNIVAMATREEPDRRYPSVEQLAEDIRRHLEGLPVRARKDTFTYRAGKFVKRHKIGLAAASLILLTLLAGGVMTLREKRKAERRFNEVRELAGSFMFEFNDAVENLPGSTPVRVLLVKRALQYLDGLSQEAGGDPSLQLELAEAYLKVGDIQGKPYRPNIGDSAGALLSYAKAQTILEPLVRDAPQDLNVLLNLSVAYESSGRLLVRMGKKEEALENARKALVLGQRLVAARPGDAVYRKRLGDSYQQLGAAMFNADLNASRTVPLNDYRQALESYCQALSIHEALSASDPTDVPLRWAVSVDYEYIGFVLRGIGDATGEAENYRLALENHLKELEVCQALSASDPKNGALLKLLGDAYADVGTSRLKVGDIGGALASFDKRLSAAEALAAADPTNVEHRGDAGMVHLNIGLALKQKGDLSGALKHYQKASEIIQSLLDRDPSNAEFRSSMTLLNKEINDLSARR